MGVVVLLQENCSWKGALTRPRQANTVARG